MVMFNNHDRAGGDVRPLTFSVAMLHTCQQNDQHRRLTLHTFQP